MRICELLEGFAYELKGSDREIARIEYDSRKVEKGDLFVCIVGTALDGHSFAEVAVKNGAVALLVQRELPIDVTQIIVHDTRSAMAHAACAYYDNPSRKLRMVGITGTNGKTTTTYMLKEIAERAGYKVGLIGTIQNMIGNTIVPTERTTPESVDLQSILARMVQEKVSICLVEVSSHSLVQERVYGIEFDVGVFTNLTQDHMDYHVTYKNYRAAKKKLFAQSKAAVINIDDPTGEYMLEGITYPVYTFGVREKADISARDIDITSQGVAFTMQFPSGEAQEIKLRIPGLFSVFNAMGSAGAALMLGFTPQQIKTGLDDLESVSGRLEKLYVGNKPYTVLLDYAHTPDAIENVLKTVRSFAKERIITLFGCGGDRDRAKRPIMGEVAGRYSDYCIIASDNPRSEDPLDIIRSIEEGMKKSGCNYAVIENRRDAIKYALRIGKADDVIILAGKGHETYQEINGVKSSFNEKEIVSKLIEDMER